MTVLRHGWRSPPRLLLLFGVVLVLLIKSVTSKGEPSFKRNDFPHLPSNYFYFENSPVILYHDSFNFDVWRSDDDGYSWSKVKDVPEGVSDQVIWHPFDEEQAFILGIGNTHWKTSNRGKSWHEFETEFPPALSIRPLAFSAAKNDYIIYFGQNCKDKWGWFGFSCTNQAYYTKNAFDTMHPLKDDVQGCVFARSSKYFTESDKHQIFCIDRDPSSISDDVDANRLVMTDDWFDSEVEVKLRPNEPIRGVIGIGVVQTFILVGVAAPRTEEMALYVTDDGYTWDQAEFPLDNGGVRQNAYTVLESTPYSIQLDVLTNPYYGHSMGSILTSNSNGTYFTRSLEHTNRNTQGVVDFESVSNIEGVSLANIVANWQEVQDKRFVSKKVQSRISNDDGRSWKPILAPKDSNCDPDNNEKCSLHLHSATEPSNNGKIFSTSAPGILIGVGSVGEFLEPYDNCDTFVSEDGGETWTLSLAGPHKYEVGDQGSIMVAVVDDTRPTDFVSYSTDGGREWRELQLDAKFIPEALTTVPDSTIRKFTLVAKSDESDAGAYVYSLDFSALSDRKCVLDENDDEKSDFQKWYARYDEQGNPTCLMGRKQYFWRKKFDRDCFVGADYHEIEAEIEFCECQKSDYECDYNFVRDEQGNCKPAFELPGPKDQCRQPDDTYLAPSGYRKIPGDSCVAKAGEHKLDDPIERKCGEAEKPSGKISHEFNHFDFPIAEYYYLERSETSSGDDETIVLRTEAKIAWMSHDHGATFTRLDIPQVVAIHRHEHFNDWMFFFTEDGSAYFTQDRARSIQSLDLPGPPLLAPGRSPLAFHSDHPDWLIFSSSKDCRDPLSPDCRISTFYTKNLGEKWDDMSSRVQSCAWARNPKLKTDENLVFCERVKDGSEGMFSLRDFVSSTNFFEDEVVHYKDIVGFTIFDEFIIVAVGEAETGALSLRVSVDGNEFADGKFPPKFDINAREAFTVLDSLTDAVFLHVTTNSEPDAEWGSILKSNSNGTYYVRSIDFVNRNAFGFVDFEKTQGLEGLAVINTVSNPQEASKKGFKNLRTQITHDDGAQWGLLSPPSKGVDGKKLCGGPLEKCSLNLHGYTERTDIRDTFSSGSAVGFMMGVGNVGPSLTDYASGDTYMTKDGGISWTQVQKGPHLYEFGDQGSILVVVADSKPTNKLLYSLNHGDSWEEYQFAQDEELLDVYDISTVPSDTSRQFLLYARAQKGSRTVAVDFRGLTARKCVLDLAHLDRDDFQLWTPQHPNGESNCLFGHEAQYVRKDPKADCYVGRKIPQPSKILRNCSCTRDDFECDYNFERANDGSCQLIKGLEPPNHAKVCQDPNVIEYYAPTGYRRIPLSTCQGGKELDKQQVLPCPGKGDEFNKKRRGLNGFAFFLVVVLPVGLAAAVTYGVYQRSKGMGLGQIRLGEESVQENIFLKYPAMAVDTVIKYALMLPPAVIGIYKFLASRFPRKPVYSTREAFASNRYTQVSADDAELLGDVDSEGDED